MKDSFELIRLSIEEAAEYNNAYILLMMEEMELEYVYLEILNHGKCRIAGCSNIHHLNWNSDQTI